MTQRINVKVSPRAKERKIVGWKDKTLLVRVCSAPEGGKANIELIKLLAKEFGIPKSGILIVQGKSSREKVLEIPACVSLQKSIF